MLSLSHHLVAQTGFFLRNLQKDLNCALKPILPLVPAIPVLLIFENAGKLWRLLGTCATDRPHAVTLSLPFATLIAG